MPWWKSKKRSSEPSAEKWTPDELVDSMGQMRLGQNSPSTIPMPEPRLWNPISGVNEPRPPIPSHPPGWNTTLPPRVRPPHLSDRPNPYDLPLPLLPVPPPQPSPLYPVVQMPMPIPVPQARPSSVEPRPSVSEAHSDPPPILRPAFNHSPAPSDPFPRTDPARRVPPIITTTPNTSSSSKPSLAPPPTLRRHVRASSEPATPVSSRSSDDGVQCSGITKTNKRCTRMVKAAHPLMLATPADDGEIEVCVGSSSTIISDCYLLEILLSAC